MTRVFLDTNFFIYLLEDCGELSRKAQYLSQCLAERRDQVVTSALTLGELLAKPLSLGDTDWASRYEQLFDTPGMNIVAFDRMCARHYARIRGDKSIKPPDAMQLACAIQGRCTLFITNDSRLSKKVVNGLDFILSLDQAAALFQG